MKTIYKLLDPTLGHVPDKEKLKQLGETISEHMAKSLGERLSHRERGVLWATDIGEPCKRKLWYKFYKPKEGEPLSPNAVFKFLYGDIIEHMVLFFLREAGHSVSKEQHKVAYKINNQWEIRGRIDAMVDGVVVDVKSTSSYGYKKYKEEGLTKENDTFGYRWQLGFYCTTLNPLSKEGDIVFVDKQNGHILKTTVSIPTQEQMDERLENIVSMLDQEETPPPKGFNDEPFGKSGNMKLSMPCSYCSFKRTCWPHVKGYAYSHGPVWLTKVKNEPKVPQIT